MNKKQKTQVFRRVSVATVFLFSFLVLLVGSVTPARAVSCDCGGSVLYRPNAMIPQYDNDFTCDSDKRLTVDNSAMWTGPVCASNVTVSPGDLSCVVDPSCINRMDVSANIAGASYTLTGPATLMGSGLSSSHSGQPSGVYTITWNDVAGYTTPSTDAQMLGDYGTISFSGNYVVTIAQPAPNTCEWQTWFNPGIDWEMTGEGTLSIGQSQDYIDAGAKWYGVCQSGPGTSCSDTNIGGSNYRFTCNSTAAPTINVSF